MLSFYSMNECIERLTGQTANWRCETLLWVYMQTSAGGKEGKRRSQQQEQQDLKSWVREVKGHVCLTFQASMSVMSTLPPR
jgi:hypothetical protein